MNERCTKRSTSLYMHSMPKNSKKILSVAVASAGALAIVAFGATSSIAAAPDVFAIATLTTDNAVFTDADALAGDDDGLMGVTGSKFLFSGDTATIAYDLADLGNPYTTDIDNATDQNNWLFSDLKTQTSYLFDAEVVIDYEYNILGIQPLDQTGDISGAVIPLSVVVTFDNTEDYCTIFASGYGRVAIWDGCNGVVYDIALPSGEVTTVTGAATFADYELTVPVELDYTEVDSYVSQLGVVEYDGSALHIVAVGVDDENSTVGIFRYDVQNAAALPTEVLSFEGDTPDIWKFTVSPATNQWCSGAEGGWEPIDGGDSSELAFCASATFTFGAPALAATGVDMSGFLVGGAVVLLAGAGLVLVARRRTVQG